MEKVPLLPGKAPFSKRFEDAVAQACESAAARQVARRFGLAESTVRAIDLRCLESDRRSLTGTSLAAETGAGATAWFSSSCANDRLRFPERWDAQRREPPLRLMGLDEIYRGKRDKFLTVVCNLETGEPLFGADRKKETLD